MRPSEYRGLPWSNVFEDRVEVRQRADKTGIIGPVKSKAGRRTIFLPKLVTEMIFDWRERSPSSKLDLVFPTETGKPLNLGNFRAGAWLPLLKEADLMEMTIVDGQEVARPKYTSYVLRHYFASKLIEKGKDLKFIQDTMGHSKIEVTLNVYGHLLKGREEEKKQTAEELAVDMLGISCGKFVARMLLEDCALMAVRACFFRQRSWLRDVFCYIFCGKKSWQSKILRIKPCLRAKTPLFSAVYLSLQSWH